MTEINAIKIRPDLKVTLNKGNEGCPELIIERIVRPGAKTKITLKADEWQELVDWLRAIFLLHRENQT